MQIRIKGFHFVFIKDFILKESHPNVNLFLLSINKLDKHKCFFPNNVPHVFFCIMCIYILIKSQLFALCLGAGGYYSASPSVYQLRNLSALCGRGILRQDERHTLSRARSGLPRHAHDTGLLQPVCGASVAHVSERQSLPRATSAVVT